MRDAGIALGEFTAVQLLDKLGLEHSERAFSLICSFLDDHVRRGIFRRADSGVGQRKWKYMRPVEAGRAAEIDLSRNRGSGIRTDLAGAISGTGKNAGKYPGASKEVVDVLNSVQRNGATVAQTQRGHFIIAGNGERIIIAPKPNPSGLAKDKARLRAAKLLTV